VLTRANFLSGGLLSLAALAVPMTAPGGGSAWAQGAERELPQQVIIDGARKTLADLRHDKAFGNAARLIPRARAVMIVPKLIKGGFIIGGEGGQGVIMVRRNGGWSYPAFYAIGSASLGLQAGAQVSEMVLLVMTQKGVDGLLRDQFKIGAQAGISVATLGSNVEGALGGPTPPDIVVWSSSSGLYGGLTIDGSIIRPQPKDNAAFYGRPVTPREILFGQAASPRAAALRRELASF
jgi:lipid-binding SYLF domain-containing protein